MADLIRDDQPVGGQFRNRLQQSVDLGFDGEARGGFIGLIDIGRSLKHQVRNQQRDAIQHPHTYPRRLPQQALADFRGHFESLPLRGSPLLVGINPPPHLVVQGLRGGNVEYVLVTQRGDLLRVGRFSAARLAVEAEIDSLLEAITKLPAHWLVVSNEVGQGLVPPFPAGRLFRDLLGWANQRLAAMADEVIWMVAGIPVPIGEYTRKE